MGRVNVERRCTGEKSFSNENCTATVGFLGHIIYRECIKIPALCALLDWLSGTSIRTSQVLLLRDVGGKAVR